MISNILVESNSTQSVLSSALTNQLYFKRSEPNELSNERLKQKKQGSIIVELGSNNFLPSSSEVKWIEWAIAKKIALKSDQSDGVSKTVIEFKNIAEAKEAYSKASGLRCLDIAFSIAKMLPDKLLPPPENFPEGAIPKRYYYVDNFSGKTPNNSSPLELAKVLSVKKVTLKDLNNKEYVGYKLQIEISESKKK
jgi:hypothetical protein